MYSRTVLKESDIQFYLNSMRTELVSGIRHAGVSILELDIPLWSLQRRARFHVHVLSRRRRNFLLGIGQGDRYNPRHRWFGDGLERWWGPAAVFWMATVWTLLWSLGCARLYVVSCGCLGCACLPRVSPSEGGV